MADNVVTINLGNGSFIDQLGEKATYSGSVRVNYTTGAVDGNYSVTRPNNQGNGTYTDGATFDNLALASSGNDTYTANNGGNTPFFQITYSGRTPSAAEVQFVDGSQRYDTANNPAGQQTLPVTSTVNSGSVCFADGTQIRIVRDGVGADVAVEDLQVGDLCVTASGERLPIRWLGRRALDCRQESRQFETHPIRIDAHAFGHGRPSRDLRVSPGHGICVDVIGEVLIPAAALVNGTTIRQEQVDTVTYWHVELERHEIILAENLPCESYLEMGNRTFFVGAETISLHANPDAKIVTHIDFCRPFHLDGPVVAFVRERLAARVPDMGWHLEVSPMAGLALEVDGKLVLPEIDGLSAGFLVPADARSVWLVSETAIPAEIGLGTDLRALGVCIAHLSVQDVFGAPQEITADDHRLCVGFHAPEQGPQRWTAGRARLPADLWEGRRGPTFFRVDLARPALPRWVMSRQDRPRSSRRRSVIFPPHVA